MSEIPSRGLYAKLWPMYRRFTVHLTGEWGYLALGCLMMLAIAATNTLMIWLFGMPIDLLNQGQYDAILKILFALAVVALVNHALHISVVALNAWLGLRFIGRVRQVMLARCLATSYPVLDKIQRGDVLTRLSADLDKVSRLMVDLPLALASHLFIFLFYAGMLFWIDFKLAILALAISPLFLIHQRAFGKHKHRVSQQFMAAFARLLSFESETMGNLRGISSFAAEKEIQRRHGHIFSPARDGAMRSKMLDAWFSSTFSVLIYLSGLLIVGFAIYAIRQGEFSVGHLVSFLLYLGYISVPVRGVAHLAMQCEEDIAAAERVIVLLDMQPIVAETSDAKPLHTSSGKIEFEKVSFTYPGGAKPVIQNVDLTIASGDTVALVGPSGSGKSTFARLLMRFYDPQLGAIKIDGSDIRHATLESLRKHVAVVWQEPFLIDDTIRANLLLARADASEAQLIQACEASYAWGFISEMEQGLDSPVGAEGTGLSAGQRQRLSLAQAFLRDAPILLLDEASSALDSHAEQMVVKAVAKLQQGRTTLIIAHRYSSIRSANYVVYFNGDGTITVGSHVELLETHPGYRQATQWQTGVTEEIIQGK